MRVFLTGGSGFVGSAVLRELLRQGHEAVVLTQRHELPVKDDRIRMVPGRLPQASADLSPHLPGCEAVIHLVGIIAENPAKGVTFDRLHDQATRSLVEAAQAAGVGRFIHMSALGTRPDAPSEYHRSKHRAEEHVRNSGLAWTIFRPSLIHGPEGEFMRQLAGWARGSAAPYLFMPYFGAGLLGTGGAGRLQPAFVDDVARAFVEALNRPQTIGKTYDLVGPDVLTWPELHRAAAQAILGKSRMVMPIPAWYGRLLTHVVPRSLLPFNRDQVLMSQEDNTGDGSAVRRDFGWAPRPFAQTLAGYASRL